MTEHTNENTDLNGIRELIVHHRSGWFAKCFATTGWLLVLLLLGLVLWQWLAPAKSRDSKFGITEQYHSGSESADEKIAIITIAGVIQDGHGYVKRQIDRIRDDENVKAVVVRVNSPGGTVSGSDYIFHHLRELRQDRGFPMVVSMGSLAASGGYYVSMAVGDQPDSIYAEPTTTTGSIGVIIPHYNVAGLLDEYKIENDSIMSHPRKNMLSPSKRLTDDQRALLQDYVDQSFERFKRIILEGRPAFRELNENAADENVADNDAADDDAADDESEDSEVADAQQKKSSKIRLEDLKTGRNLATGEVFTATSAQEFGLVDRLGFIEAAIERAAELANVQVDDVLVVKYAAPAPWIDIPYLNRATSHSPSDAIVKQLLQTGTPRAYYLASSFPPLMDTSHVEEP